MGLLERERGVRELLKKFPKLSSRRLFNNEFIITGEVDIFDVNDIYWDSYNIRFSVPQNYPYSFPKLFETSNKIKRNIDWHIFSDGSCCVTVIHDEQIRAQQGITLLEYMMEYAIPFFANQIFFKENKNEKWVNGDYKHGEDAFLQYYIEILKIKDQDEAIFILENFQRFSTSNRNEKCLCLSDKKFKHCHLSIIKKLLNISKEQRTTDLKSFLLNSGKTGTNLDKEIYPLRQPIKP